MGPGVVQRQRNRVEVGMRLAPAVEVSRRGSVSSYLASQGAQQERVVAKGTEEWQQLRARATSLAANEGAPQRQRVVVAQPGEEEGIAAGPGQGRGCLEFRRVEPSRDEHARGAHLRQPPQEVPGARVGALAQAV